MKDSCGSQQSEQFLFKHEKIEDLKEANNRRKKITKPFDIIRNKSHHENLENKQEKQLNQIRLYHENMENKQKDIRYKQENSNESSDGLKKAIREFANKFEDYQEKHNEFIEANNICKMLDEATKNAKCMLQEPSRAVQQYGLLHKQLMEQTGFSGESEETQELERAHKVAFQAMESAKEGSEKARRLLPQLRSELEGAKRKLEEASKTRVAALKEAKDAQVKTKEFLALEKVEDLNARIEILNKKDGKKDIDNLQTKLEIIHNARENSDDPAITKLKCNIENLAPKKEALENKKTDYETTLENMKLFDTSLLIKTRDSLAKTYRYEAFNDKPFIPEAQEILTEEDFQDEWIFTDDTKDTCEASKFKYQSKLKDLEELQNELKNPNSNRRKKLVPNKIESVVYDILNEMDQEIRGAKQYKLSLDKISSYLRKKYINLKKEYLENYEITEKDIDDQLRSLKQYNDALITDLRLKVGII